MDRGAWQAMVHGVAESRTCLKRLSTRYVLIYFLPMKHGKEGWELLTTAWLWASSCVVHSRLGGSVTDRQGLYLLLSVFHMAVWPLSAVKVDSAELQEQNWHQGLECKQLTWEVTPGDVRLNPAGELWKLIQIMWFRLIPPEGESQGISTSAPLRRWWSAAGWGGLINLWLSNLPVLRFCGNLIWLMAETL